MTHHHQDHLLFSIILSLSFFLLLLSQETNASPYVISDDRVRSLDSGPALGRGYSISSNTFQTTCLDVDEVHAPSYNYDCKLRRRRSYDTYDSLVVQIKSSEYRHAMTRKMTRNEMNPGN